MKDFKQQLIEIGIETLENWTYKKGYTTDFDYCVQDEFRPNDKLITINTRQGRENQLYALLHECGHLILDKNEESYAKKYPSSMKLAYRNNKRLEKSYKYKVDVVAEEIDAWRKGRALANRLNIYVDDEKYYTIMTKCVYGYIMQAARS